MSAGIIAAAGPVARRIVDLLLPSRCLACGTLVDEQGRLCAGCWAGLEFITGRCCRCCGVPMPAVAIDDAICEPCLDEPKPFARARAALRYSGIGRRLVLRFKHGDRLDGVASFARWMCRAAAPLLEQAEVVVPVPLHRWRLLGRGYNQSAVLALAIGREAGLPVLVDGLVKQRATAAQQTLRAAERRTNLDPSVFAVPPRRLSLIRDRRVLLVDDVLTTGSTVAVATMALRSAGAASVDVLTLARVVFDD